MRLPIAVVSTLAIVGASCSLAPRYQPPTVAVPADFGGDANWQVATQGEESLRGSWWSRYRDPVLDRLEEDLDAGNPDVAAAAARYGQARALAAEAGAGLFPAAALQGYGNRDRQSDHRPLRSAAQPAYYRDYLLGGVASYELDLWGRVRNTAAAGRSTAQATAADLAALRLSLEAELAQNYLTLRGVDRQLKLYDDSVRAYRRALQLVEDRYQGGIASGLDLARAQSQLAAGEAQLTDLGARRALYQHAIARLVGKPPDALVLAPQAVLPTLPDVPFAVPSKLLERRPDIAAAERRVAAANAQIGVARAAYFPRVTLTASGGYQDTTTVGWLSAPNRFWALGPQALLAVFDVGLRRAEVARARSAFDEAAARYRGTVLSAFQEVADNLSLLKALELESQQQALAARAANRALELASNRYSEGAVSYLDVVTAQTAALQADGTLLALEVRRLAASVGLVRGLGGGWSDAELPTPSESTSIRRAESR